MQPAIFIDRDDTLIHNIPYLSDPSKVVLTPGAGTTLAALAKMGFQLFLITNQSGIGRGYFTVHELNAVHDRLKELLRALGVVLDGIYYCPHAPNQECNCRKPKTGMLEQACAEHRIDLARSIMVGDGQQDIEMGKAFGLRTVQLRLKGVEKEDFHADLLITTLPEMLDFARATLAAKA